MQVVYEVSDGKLSEYALVKETDKMFKVNFIRDGKELDHGTRILKERDSWTQGAPFETRWVVATLDKEKAKELQIKHLESFVYHHQNELYGYKDLLKQAYADK